jgi:DNA repair exonuclease SbcCD nuclease subunit
MAIEKICHIADIHIRKTPTRNDEYEKVFENLIESLKKEKPDRIVIVGDLVHDYLDLQGEQLIMAHNLLNELSKIAPVRITRGNHDCRKKNLKRVDSVKAIVKTLNNSNVEYYDNTGFHPDANIIWAVWHHGEQKNNPWKTKDGKLYEKNRVDTTPSYGGEPVINYTFVDLFHDPVNGCKSTTNFEMKSKSYYKLTDFKGDLSFFGDIHKMQYLDKEQTKAYCGSLIAQDFSEGDDNFHGYLLWDVATKTAKPVPVYNEYSYVNIKISPYTDFDDLDFEIPNATKYMRVRFVWMTLPQTRTNENERKLASYVKSKYGNVTISHKNEFLEKEKISIDENVNLENVSEKTVQHSIFKEFLEKIGTDSNVINDVILLDDEITNEIDLGENMSIEWDIIKFGGRNFASYAELDIDWRDMEGLFQITGINTAGKTTIMKLISYVLFGKALETESKMKYGDKRFVNNRNGSSFCEAYLVIEANGEYFGIKKKTEITRTKDGEINGAPTTMNYYMLASPDDEMTDDNLLDKLTEDQRNLTQKKLEAIIGSYDNFMRIVMTTSDTLNTILKNEMADFIDSLLYDSGLDVFDKKLEGLKSYQKKVNEKPRVTCNVETTAQSNELLKHETGLIQSEISKIEFVKLPEVQDGIKKGRNFVETLTKKLFKIDSEIYNLNVADVKEEIDTHKGYIVKYKDREAVLREGIIPLKESYDAEKLTALLEKKEQHKTDEYSHKMEIKAFEQEKMTSDHIIEIFNGDVFRLKAQGAQYKKEIQELKESKTCPTCGQTLLPEHQSHINEKIKATVALMYPLADQIKTIENVTKKKHQDDIEETNKKIEAVKILIQNQSLEMEGVLKEIGVLTNEKNDVDKRKELQMELDQIPVKIQNEELKIGMLQQKIDNHDNSLLQIEENKKIEKKIAAAKLRLFELETEENGYKEEIYAKKANIADKQIKIKNNELLIAEFKIQEYRDTVMNLYKKCVHRDGIPRQILTNYILPKINLTLENILSVAPFKIWLDQNDLRPKLVYNNRPAAIIDCISASGKERTFSSIVLKFALNQINVKAKPMMFLLDEVMGKLDLEGSVEEFIEILHMIKSKMKRLLVVEQVHEINPDYLISVQLNEEGISSLTIE